MQIQESALGMNDGEEQMNILLHHVFKEGDAYVPEPDVSSRGGILTKLASVDAAKIMRYMSKYVLWLVCAQKTPVTARNDIKTMAINSVSRRRRARNIPSGPRKDTGAYIEK